MIGLLDVIVSSVFIDCSTQGTVGVIFLAIIRCKGFIFMAAVKSASGVSSLSTSEFLLMTHLNAALGQPKILELRSAPILRSYKEPGLKWFVDELWVARRMSQNNERLSP